jgi:DNA-binding LacI/PurR family transcriptional regulator
MVAVDQRLGARLATNHLLELGHRTVWHIAGPEDWYESGERIEGWQEALSDAAAPAPPVVRGDWSAASGYRVAHDLMGRTSKASAVSAVFAANDQMALGFMHALFERGMTAPHPISLVGYDDLPELAYFSPALTTVRQDFDEMGRRAVQLLAWALDGRSLARDHLELIEPRLVLRSSTAAPEASDRRTR